MSKVATEVSSSLFWHPFEGVVEKEPLFVQYQKYDAQSATSSEISWYIESPANGVLLDNEVWLHTTLQITDGDIQPITSIRSAWCNTNAAVSSCDVPTDTGTLTAFRSGCPIQRCCQSIALDINGTVMTYEFSKYHDAFNRMFLTKEEAGSVFPSGGGFLDDGAHLGLYDGYFPNQGNAYVNIWGNTITPTGNAALSVGTSGYKGNNGTQTATTTVSNYVGNNYRLTNMGFSKRAQFLEYMWRTADPVGSGVGRVYQDATRGAASSTRYPAAITLHIYEKLAFSPFHLYDNRDIKMSIPNIRNLSLTFQFHSSYWRNMFRCAIQAPDMNSNSIDFYSIKPQLFLRWYTPPPGYVIPKQVSLPVTKVWTYTNSTLTKFDLSDTYGATSYPVQVSSGFSVSNISLPAVPDLFLIYFKRRLSEYSVLYPDDYNLSIKSIQIDFEGNSGKLNNSSPIHFWNMYRRHLRLYPADRDDFQSWYRYHCVLAVTASDMGVIKGPGMDNPIQLSLSNVVLEYYYMIPSYNNLTNADGGGNGLHDPSFNPENANENVNFDLHIVCVYDKYALTLTADGSSALQLLRVNSQGTSTAPPQAVGPSSLADISI